MSDDITITSTDGTALSARVSGSGPPLVLVHGTATDKDSWAFVIPQLKAHHTVWCYDRRGRGGSGDAAKYDPAMEAADVRAVVAAAGADVHLLGHSYGGYCCLEAATQSLPLQSLILYEVPLHQARRDEAVQRAFARLAAHDDEAALSIFLLEVVGFSEDELALVRSLHEVWDRMLAMTSTVHREATVLATRRWDAPRYAGIDQPVSYLTGALTESPVYLSPAEVKRAFPQARHVALEGQRHIAMATGPQLLAETVLDLTSVPRRPADEFAGPAIRHNM
jgi:pimeloyl-ACP methyl ester carboxylesterase